MTPITEQDAEAGLTHEQWIASLAEQRRFGPGDKLGVANLIDAAARRRAVDAMVNGSTSSLARPLIADSSRPNAGVPPLVLEVSISDVSSQLKIGQDQGPRHIGGGDRLDIRCHGLLYTHTDALNHIGKDGMWYGGWAVDDPEGPSILDMAQHGLTTRGILADIPAVRGTEWVDPNEPVSGEDIDAALARAGVTFEPGDALLLYMGRDRFEASGHEFDVMQTVEVMPGVGWSGARWIADHGVSILCWDFLDSTHPSEPSLVVHWLIWALGLVLVDNCHLGDAAAAARGSGSITGGLIVRPLPVKGATGSVVDPLFIQ